MIELFLTRQEAEAALRDVLTDEPGWSGIVGIAEVDLGFASPN